MKGNYTTVKKVIENTQSQTKEIFSTFPEDWDSKSEIQKRALLVDRDFTRQLISITKKNDAVYLYLVNLSPRITGNRIITRRMSHCLLAMIGNEVKVKDPNISGEYINQFLTMMNINWTRDLGHKLREFLKKPAILKGVLTNRIYSQETLVKRIASQVYKIKNVEWRLLRDYLNIMSVSSFDISLFDLSLYTKDINNTLRTLLKYEKEQQYETLRAIKDTIKNAKVLDKKST